MTVHTKSSAEIEREVEAQRAGIAHTLDEISTRLTPGQLLDEAWALARETGGGTFVRNLGTSARDNPLPVGLITAGIGWLMSGRSGAVPRMRRSSRSEDYFRTEPFENDYPPSLGEYEHESDKSDKGPGRLKSAAQSTAASASATAAAAKDRLGRAVGVVGDASRIAADDAMESAERLRRSAIESGRRLGSRARETSRQAQARAASFADEQPVVLAVAGLALGALVAAFVRSTDAESRLVGEASDRVKDQARDLASRGFEQGSEVVKGTFEAVREEAEKQGLTTAAASSAAGDLADKVTKVAKKGRAKMEQELGAGSSGQGHDGG